MKIFNLPILLLPLSSNAFPLRHIVLRQNVHSVTTSRSLLQSTPSNEEGKDDGTSDGYRPGSLMEATLREGRVPYGETSRKYRRTEFSYNDWVSHRSSDKKILTNIKGMFFSGIIRQLREEITLVTLLAAFVVVWNDFLYIPDEILSVGLPRLALPALPFTLSSPALGLLLVFKTNASYARWLEARNTWAKIISQGRNTLRMASTFVPQTLEGEESIRELSKAIWLLCRCLMNELSDPSDEEVFEKEVINAFSSSSSEASISIVPKIIQSSDRTMVALVHASRTLDSVPIDEKRRVEIDKSLVIIGDCISVCEKVYSSPVPLVYTRHTGRFLALWMLLLPTALYDAFAVKDLAVPTLFGHLQGLAVIPTTAFVGLFLFGIEELAIQVVCGYYLLSFIYIIHRLTLFV
jgi:putative membrane protein